VSSGTSSNFFLVTKLTCFASQAAKGRAFALCSFGWSACGKNILSVEGKQRSPDAKKQRGREH